MGLPSKVLLSRILLVMVLAFSGSELVAQENERLVGSWRGGLEVGGGASLTIVFNISQDAGGTFTGTMDSPGQGVVGIPLTSTTPGNGPRPSGIVRVPAKLIPASIFLNVTSSELYG